MADTIDRIFGNITKKGKEILRGFAIRAREQEQRVESVGQAIAPFAQARERAPLPIPEETVEAFNIERQQEAREVGERFKRAIPPGQELKPVPRLPFSFTRTPSDQELADLGLPPAKIKPIEPILFQAVEAGRKIKRRVTETVFENLKKTVGEIASVAIPKVQAPVIQPVDGFTADIRGPIQRELEQSITTAFAPVTVPLGTLFKTLGVQDIVNTGFDNLKKFTDLRIKEDDSDLERSGKILFNTLKDITIIAGTIRGVSKLKIKGKGKPRTLVKPFEQLPSGDAFLREINKSINTSIPAGVVPRQGVTVSTPAGSATLSPFAVKIIKSPAGQSFLRNFGKLGFTIEKKPFKAPPPERIIDLPDDLAPREFEEEAIRKISKDEDVFNIIKETEKRFKKEIGEQTRGVQTNEMTNQLAREMGMTADEFIKIRKGTALNAEQIQAGRSLLKNTTEKVAVARTEWQTLKDTGKTDLQAELRLRQAMEKQAAVQRVLRGARAESGRALQIQRTLAQELPTEAKALEALMKALGGRDLNNDVLEAFSKIDPNDTMAVNAFLRDVHKAKTSDVIFEIWLNGILSNPKTQIVNIASNTAFSLMQPLIRTGEAILELPKGKNREVFFGEVPAQVFGGLQGLSEGVRKALFIFRNGITPEQSTKIEHKLPALKGKTGEVIRAPTKALTAADEFFKAINGTAELHALAYRQAKKEGLKGNASRDRIAEIIDNPPADILEKVEDFKLETTFQTPLGKPGQAIMKVRDDIPGMKYIIPFIRTPGNIVKEGLRLTPLGFLEAGKKAVKGEPGATKALSKATIGSMIGIAVVLKVLEGKMTGAAPKNKAERDAFFRAGKQPNAIKVGDQWVGYGRIEPMATAFGLISDIVEQIDKEGEAPEDVLKNVVALISDNLVNKTFMSGLSSAMNAMTDPQRYGENWIELAGSGFVPFGGLSSFAARATDPTLRTVEGVKEAVQAKIPGLSQQLLPRRNVFGEEIQLPQRGLTPIPVSGAEQTPLDQELEKVGVNIGFPSRTITIKGKKFKLTAKEYDAFLSTHGPLMKDALNRLIQTPAYQQLEDNDKEKLINKVVTETRDLVRDAFKRRKVRE